MRAIASFQVRVSSALHAARAVAVVPVDVHVSFVGKTAFSLVDADVFYLKNACNTRCFDRGVGFLRRVGFRFLLLRCICDRKRGD